MQMHNSWLVNKLHYSIAEDKVFAMLLNILYAFDILLFWYLVISARQTFSFAGYFAALTHSDQVSIKTNFKVTGQDGSAVHFKIKKITLLRCHLYLYPLTPDSNFQTIAYLITPYRALH